MWRAFILTFVAGIVFSILGLLLPYFWFLAYGSFIISGLSFIIALGKTLFGDDSW